MIEGKDVVRRAAAALAAATALGGLAVAPAAAAPEEPKTTALKPVVVTDLARGFSGTDGARSIVYVDQHRQIRLLQEDPAGAIAARTVAPGCQPGIAARSALLLECRDGEGVVDRVLTFPDGTTHPVPGLQSGDSLELAGRVWAAGHDTSPKYAIPVFLNLTTGERRRAPGANIRSFDLDSPVLAAKPARPPGVTVGPDESPVPSTARIAVRHAGRTVVVRDRCRCNAAALSSGLVTWVEDDTIHAHRLRDGRTFAWRPSRALLQRVHQPGGLLGALHVATTRTRVVWALPLVETHADGFHRTLILSARLPAAKPVATAYRTR